MSQQMPPMNAIRVFEVAARHLSFVRAADELGVTQSAISKQIATLEEFIGAQLFEREASGVSLTLEGRELKQSLAPAFEILRGSFRRYSRKSRSSNTLRLATVASFAAQFLIPRMRSFEDTFPDTRLEILTSDRLLDLSREAVDLSIRYGAGEWQGVVSTELTEGNLLPVCAAEVFHAHGGDLEKILASERRIQVFLKNEWHKFEDDTGRPRQGDRQSFVLEHFLVAMQSVFLGQGVALLPEIIVRDPLNEQALVQIAAPVSWDHSFYLSHLPGADRQPGLCDFVSWLKTEVAMKSD